MTGMTPGQFAVIGDSLYHDAKERPIIAEIREVLPKTIKGTFRIPRTWTHRQVLAAFDTREEAQRLVNTIDGIRGEKDRRCHAAQVACHAAIDAKIKELTS